MPRKINPDGRAKRISISYPDSDQNNTMLKFLKNMAKEKEISESELIMRVLTNYYVRVKNR